MKTARVHHAARRRGGVAARGARAAAGTRVRRVGVLMPVAAERSGKARLTAFPRDLNSLGGPRAAMSDRFSLCAGHAISTSGSRKSWSRCSRK